MDQEADERDEREHQGRERIEPEARGRREKSPADDPARDRLDDRGVVAREVGDEAREGGDRREADRADADRRDEASCRAACPSSALTQEAREREGRDEPERRSSRHRHHFSRLILLTSIVSVWRKRATKIARPTAASAAAIAMTKKTTIWPSRRAERGAVAEERQVRGVHHQLDREEDRDRVAPQERAREADRRRALPRRAGRRRAGSSRSWALLPPRQDERADERREQQDRERLEGEQVVARRGAARAARRVCRAPRRSPDGAGMRAPARAQQCRGAAPRRATTRDAAERASGSAGGSARRPPAPRFRSMRTKRKSTRIAPA